MNAGSAGFDLVTKVLDARHLPILGDWLSFLPRAPACVRVYVGVDGAIEAGLRRLVGDDAALEIFAKVEGEDLRGRETAILRRMTDRSEQDLFLFVNLDTLPFRRGEDDWLDRSLERMAELEAMFLSGCGLTFRADRPLSGTDMLLTQRFSNNFALVQAQMWRQALAEYPEEMVQGDPAERFHSEWAVERFCVERGVFGLRRRDGADWRVFHVHQWDDRLLATRALFRAGKGVERFYDRCFEDCRYEWQAYFNYPQPSFWRRARIEAGRWRRAVTGG